MRVIRPGRTVSSRNADFSGVIVSVPQSSRALLSAGVKDLDTKTFNLSSACIGSEYSSVSNF
ncbi:MAG TPA: hypothetical protein VHZ55_21880, partial [Bryobacteraceae bacterium]|nr:hypothetical protein [Bryobacteraceae bacterium]